MLIGEMTLEEYIEYMEALNYFGVKDWLLDDIDDIIEESEINKNIKKQNKLLTNSHK